MAKQIFIFTQHFPYGIGEKWKYDEILVLSKYFGKIYIIPYQAVNKNPNLVLPENVEVLMPLLPSEIEFKNLLKSYSFNVKVLWVYGKDLIFKKVYLKKVWLKTWLLNLLITDHLIGKKKINKYLLTKKKNDILYFYWGAGPGYLMPFLNSKDLKTLVKFHGGDLYEYRNEGYLPLRKEILKKVDYALCISRNGQQYLNKKYSKLNFKTRLTRLGVYSIGTANFSTDGILRILSCSFMLPVKRIDLIIDAFYFLKIPIEWTHIGDGPMYEQLHTKSQRLPSNIKVNFTGFIPSDKIQEYYNGKTIDLFLNVSESEGVPVSIMEAIAAEIPIYATNVGGTGELVNDTIGKLLPADLSPNALAAELETFFHLPIQAKQALKKNTHLVFKKSCNASVLYHDFARFLIEL